MAKTHLQLVEGAELAYTKALLEHQTQYIKRTLHEDIIAVSHLGYVYKGIDRNPYISSEDWKFESIDISERIFSLFNSVAIVVSYEKRKGQYLGHDFECDFCMTRTWKFEDNRWQVVGMVAQQLDLSQVLDLPMME